MFTIRRHQDDKDMLEIITRRVSARHPSGITTLWAIVYEDFLSYAAIPDEKTRIAIRSGEEIEFKLVVLKSE